MFRDSLTLLHSRVTLDGAQTRCDWFVRLQQLTFKLNTQNQAAGIKSYKTRRTSIASKIKKSKRQGLPASVTHHPTPESLQDIRVRTLGKACLYAHSQYRKGPEMLG